ncbi:spore germination protein GerPE [Cohnella yongneupensis]|uniref:Spore germination protein GerPE n=1 Tax=Cohnella yongneupensis TaxID=425006 RepID=A0ABW0R2N3_9BACL
MTLPSGRSTNIGWMNLNTVSSSGVAQFGDNGTTELTSRALAVQRAVANYSHDETRFAAYEIFARPAYNLDTCVQVAFHKTDCVPEIRIGYIDVTAISSAALLRAGIGGPLLATTRIKHIRNFNYRDIR